MTLNEMKDLLTYVWYLFLICVLMVLIVGIIYNTYKQIKNEQETKKMVDELLEEILKEEKK